MSDWARFVDVPVRLRWPAYVASTEDDPTADGYWHWRIVAARCGDFDEDLRWISGGIPVSCPDVPFEGQDRFAQTKKLFKRNNLFGVGVSR